jgi:hypothetical protein
MTQYPSEWHAKFGKMTQDSADIILSRLRRLREFDSCVEVGCGQAHWSNAALKLGCTRVRAIDGPWNDPDALIIDRSLYESQPIDSAFAIDGQFDLALCLEVAEHVDSKYCMDLVKQLTQASKMILFGAAIPHQGGFGHINEQWQSWWAEKFLNASFVAFDIVRPAVWKDDRVHYWYKQNAILYVHKDIAGELDIHQAGFSQNWSNGELVADLVHPEKYLSFAEHDQVSLGKLARKLPGHIWGRIRSKFA